MKTNNTARVLNLNLVANAIEDKRGRPYAEVVEAAARAATDHRVLWTTADSTEQLRALFGGLALHYQDDDEGMAKVQAEIDAAVAVGKLLNGTCPELPESPAHKPIIMKAFRLVANAIED